MKTLQETVSQLETSLKTVLDQKIQHEMSKSQLESKIKELESKVEENTKERENKETGLTFVDRKWKKQDYYNYSKKKC